MADNRVQLKREEIVGDSTALTDIYPKTNTASVDDNATGKPMSETLDALWNAINNKLSRIVNSVNGRTGVVELDANDVGLGNVDNVSFGDIKDWVINMLGQEFENKRLKLFDKMEDLDTFIVDAGDDPAFENTSFYSVTGYGNDKRGFIGYIYKDPLTGKLIQTSKVINTVGYTDNSLLYNEGRVPGGGLALNIWKYEDALEIYNDASGNKEESGLRIKKEKIAGRLLYYPNMYGDGTLTDPSALLYQIGQGGSAKEVKIFVNDVDVAPRTVIRMRQELQLNDIIITNFGYTDDYYINDSLSSTMIDTLVRRQMSLGKVTKAPTTDDPDSDYEIQMYQLKPTLGRGLTYFKTHTDSVDDDTAIGLDIMHGKFESVMGKQVDMNVSGINAYSDPVDNGYPVTEAVSHPIVTPAGIVEETNVDSTGPNTGVFIATDSSIAITPHSLYNDTLANPLINYHYTGPDYHQPDIDLSTIGVNLNKLTTNGGRNISGLRIDKGDDNTSGGLSVNPGKFLIIEEGPKYPSTFYEAGMVALDNDLHASIGPSFYDPEKVGVLLYHAAAGGAFTWNRDGVQGGLRHMYNNEDDPTNSGLAVNIGMGLSLSNYNRNGSSILDKKNLTPEQMANEYNMPLAVNIVDVDNGADGIPERSGASDRENLYGGLRFIPDGSYGAVVGVRVNDDNTFGGYSTGSKAQRGSNGITIDPYSNILSVQPMSKPDYKELVTVVPFERLAEEWVGDHVFLQLGTQRYDAKSNFPDPTTNPQTNRVYCEYSKGYPTHYVFDKNDKEYIRYCQILKRTQFVEQGIKISDDEIITPKTNVVYVVWDGETAEFYTWGEFSTIHTPDVGDDGTPDAQDASLVLSEYAITSVNRNSQLTPEQRCFADIDYDGIVDARDASVILDYYKKSSTDSGKSYVGWDGWVKFLNENEIYDKASIRDQWVLIYKTTEFSPGVSVAYNKNAGLCATTRGGVPSGSTAQYRYSRDELAISIYDPTAIPQQETYMLDTYRSGGLRFGRDGVLAVRINDKSNYSSFFGLADDDLVQGTKGLKIYDKNVLGVQLPGNGGYLGFDNSGNLVITDEGIGKIKDAILGANQCLWQAPSMTTFEMKDASTGIGVADLILNGKPIESLTEFDRYDVYVYALGSLHHLTGVYPVQGNQKRLICGGGGNSISSSTNTGTLVWTTNIGTLDNKIVVIGAERGIANHDTPDVQSVNMTDEKIYIYAVYGIKNGRK